MLSIFLAGTTLRINKQFSFTIKVFANPRISQVRPFIYWFLGDIAKVEESWKIPTKARSGKESEMNNYIVLDHFYFLLLVLKEWLLFNVVFSHLCWCQVALIWMHSSKFFCYKATKCNEDVYSVSQHNKNIDKLASSKKHE